MSSKTEKPTARALRRARHAGDVPISKPLSQAVGLLVLLVLLPSTVKLVASNFDHQLSLALQEPSAWTAWDLARMTLLSTVPILSAVLLSSLFVGAIQSGGLVRFGSFGPRFRGMDATHYSGCTPNRLFACFRVVTITVLSCLLLYWALRRHLPSLANAVGSLDGAVRVTLAMSLELGWVIALVALALACADFVILRIDWVRRHRMSRSDLQRERRETGADPELRRQRLLTHIQERSWPAERAGPETTLLVTDGFKLAVALSYREAGDSAPRLIRKARDRAALELIARARSNSVPAIENPALAHALAELDVGAPIQERHYLPVAKLLNEFGGGAPARA